MRRCSECGRVFPKRLVQDLVMSRGAERRLLCPLCALRIKNKAHNLPSDTPFHSRTARGLHAEAVEWLERKERQ